MTADVKPRRSPVGIELVRRLSSEGDRIFTTDRARELAPLVGLKDSYVCEALQRLGRDGWIVPLRRGLYAMSSAVPGSTFVHEFEVAMALAHPAAISHWSALHLHGLTEQVPRAVFVLTTTESSVPRTRGEGVDQGSGWSVVGDTAYRFIQVQPKRFFGVERVWVGDARVTVTDRERTLLDGLSMPRHCGGFAEVLHAFDVALPDLDIDRITGYALQLDAATAKRLGWVLERLGVEPLPLEELPIKGYRKLDPSGPDSGPHNGRWMVRENLPGLVGA
ncbi:MAG: hypothetical protein F4Y92_02210 [Dehalococcoidia bacterium]|nr:hypothetical protein [Dehalococcoidia bacterium]